MSTNSKIRKIEYLPDSRDLTVWFEGSDEPFSPSEFDVNSYTRMALNNLLYSLVKHFELDYPS